MKKAVNNSEILNKSFNWQSQYLKCEDVKSDLTLYSKDLRFLQQLLDRYFDDIIKYERLDEMRESLMHFQDVCYNCDKLKKRVKEQQTHILNMIKGVPQATMENLIVEQSEIEEKLGMLRMNFKMVKKEMYTIAGHVLEVEKATKNTA